MAQRQRNLAAEPRLALFTQMVSSFALAELGDKTTLATVTLAQRCHWAGVWIGTVGMILADGLAISTQNLLLHRRLPGCGSGWPAVPACSDWLLFDDVGLQDRLPSP